MKSLLTLLICLCCFNLAFSQSQQNSISYEPIFVPLPQGDYVRVGSFVPEKEMMMAAGEILLDIKSKMPLAAIKVMGVNPDHEPELLAELTAIHDKRKISIPTTAQKSFARWDLMVKVSASHNLKDRISILPESIIFETKKHPVLVSRDVELYRIATPLRNYGDDSVHSFRIPGLVTTSKGTLLAVYDVRRNSSKDLQGDIDVGLSRSQDGGQSWEPMRIIMDRGTWGDLPEGENGVGDPAILVDPQTGEIWVAALWMHGKADQMAWNSSKPGLDPDETGQFLIVKSQDDGKTWSKPVNITSQIKNPEWNLFFNGPGKGIVMKDGTLVFPAQYKDSEAMPFSTVIYSKDKGNTWQVGSGAKSNTTEAQVVELQDGSLMLNMRDNRGGSRSVAVTEDLGQNWVEHSTSRSALPEPVCMASLIDNPFEDAMLLFSNPASEKGRSNITIKASLDDGKSWDPSQQVLLDEGTGWGYSCLTMINKKEVGILYESSVSNITFQIVPLKEILK